jgi:RNA polymerase sigma-70 factor (ECF subfamily)
MIIESAVTIELVTVEQVVVRQSFEALYRAEYPRLLAVATALTGDRREGEDLVQDTMVKAFVRWPRVGGLERPGGWCHRVLTNACRSRRRRRRTEQRFLAAQSHAEPHYDQVPAAVLAFWSVVRTMPERPRAVVAMYYCADRSTVEIAEILGVPEGTVRSDLSRARVILARELGA